MCECGCKNARQESSEKEESKYEKWAVWKYASENNWASCRAAHAAVCESYARPAARCLHGSKLFYCLHNICMQPAFDPCKTRRWTGLWQTAGSPTASLGMLYKMLVTSKMLIYVVQDIWHIQCALIVATENCHDLYIHTSSSGFCSLPVWESTKAFWISLCKWTATNSQIQVNWTDKQTNCNQHNSWNARMPRTDPAKHFVQQQSCCTTTSKQTIYNNCR